MIREVWILTMRYGAAAQIMRNETLLGLGWSEALLGVESTSERALILMRLMELITSIWTMGS